MTAKERHDDEERLTRLYREQGDIEPGPGVDQRIRAKARSEIRPSSLPRPAHWLGGVAVAASLFVVVSIVTNIQPPEAQLPVSESTRTTAEPGAGARQAPKAEAPAPRAPEARGPRSEAAGLAAPREDAADSADFASGLASDAQLRAEPEALQERATANDSAPPPDTDSMLQRRTRWSAGDDAAQIAREHYQAVGELDAAARGEAQASKRLELADQSVFESSDEAADEAERSLWLIRQLLSIGNVERAQAELDEFRQRFPEREVPKGIMAELAQPTSSPDPD